MIPGTISKLSRSALASHTTISPKTDYVRLAGNTAVATINPPYEGFSGILLISPDAATATVTTGNIAVAVTMAADRVTVLVYDKVTAKWYPGAIS